MYILNLPRAIKKVLVNVIRDFIFENFCNRIGFSKENSYYLVEHLKRKKNIKRFIDACKQINRKKFRSLKEHYYLY